MKRIIIFESESAYIQNYDHKSGCPKQNKLMKGKIPQHFDGEEKRKIHYFVGNITDNICGCRRIFLKIMQVAIRVYTLRFKIESML